MSTPLLSIPEIAEGQAGKYITHNEALALIEGLITRVLSRTNGGPPGSPSEGATYIVDVADNAWSGASVGDIAHFYSGSWHFVTPVEGLSIRCVAEGQQLYYNGSIWGYTQVNQVSMESPSLPDESASGVLDKAEVVSNSVGFGAAMYVDGDGKLQEASASAAATLRCMALMLETGTGQGKTILRWGRIRNDAWAWTVGGLVFVGTTPGELTQVAPSGTGEFVQVVGEAESATTIMFSPSYDAIELL